MLRYRTPGQNGYSEVSADALLKIVLVRQDATFWPPARARRIDDARRIFSRSRDECRLALRAKFLPPFCPKSSRIAGASVTSTTRAPKVLNSSALAIARHR